MATTEWTTLIGQYWVCGWLKTQEDVKAAVEEMREYFRSKPPDNLELCKVLRLMAGPDGKQSKCPTLRELIRSVCISRTPANMPSEKSGELCGLCKSTGWLDVYVECGPEITYQESCSEVVQVVPCLCSHGQAAITAMDKSTDKPWTNITKERLENHQRLQRLGKAQAVCLNRETRTAMDALI